MRAAPATYYSIVIVDNVSDRIVAIGTVFIERKFLRGFGSVGHIEDIAVDKSQQGKKLGLRIIQALTHISENTGCYKTILNCNDGNIRESLVDVCGESAALTSRHVHTAFYEKCGYTKKENEMVSVAVIGIGGETDIVDPFSGQVRARTLTRTQTVNPTFTRSLPPWTFCIHLPISFAAHGT